MGGGSEGEEGLHVHQPPPSSGTDGCERIKSNRKPFYGCNSVHSAIPRKQRSAMNKRTRESTSPPLPDAKKLHHPSNDTQSPQTKCSKKPKQNRKHGGVSTRLLRQAVSGLITKDEEEVVETLYALAKMFPNKKLDKGREDEKASESKSSPLQETSKIYMLASDATKEDSMKLECASAVAEVTNLSSSVEVSPRETVKDYPSTKSTILEQSTVLASHKIDQPLVQADPERIPLLPKSEHIDDTPLGDVNLSAPCELVPGMGIKLSTQLEWLHDQKQQMEQEQLQPINDNKGSCASIACEEGTPVLWPGLSRTESRGGRVQCPSAWSSSNKAPASSDSTMYTTRSSSTGDIVPNEESNSHFQSVIADIRKPWKKSAVHVYISCLIQACQTADKKTRWAVPTIPLKAAERTNLGVKSTNRVTDLRNSQNGTISSGITKDMKEILLAGSSGSSSRKNQREKPSGISLEMGLQQDQQQASKTSRICTSSNQSGDFLSLSAGHGSLEFTTVSNGGNHGRNVLECPPQNLAPNLCSISQCHAGMPLALSQAWYISPPYVDIMKMADRQQLQQLQFMDGSFYSTPHLAHAGLAKQREHQIMWAAKLVTSQDGDGCGRTMSDILKKQNGINDFPMWPCSQPVLPFSAPFEKPGAMVCPRPPPQQHLYVVSSSSSSSKGKRHQHHLPRGCDLGGGFYAQGTSHLLCNSDQF